MWITKNVDIKGVKGSSEEVLNELVMDLFMSLKRSGKEEIAALILKYAETARR